MQLRDLKKDGEDKTTVSLRSGEGSYLVVSALRRLADFYGPAVYPLLTKIR